MSKKINILAMGICIILMGSNLLHAEDLNCLKLLQSCLNTPAGESHCKPFEGKPGWEACNKETEPTKACSAGCQAMEADDKCAITCNGQNLKSIRECMHRCLNWPPLFTKTCNISFETTKPEDILACIMRIGNSTEKPCARQCVPHR